MLPLPRTPASTPYLQSPLGSHHCCISPDLQQAHASLAHPDVLIFSSVMCLCYTPILLFILIPSQRLSIPELSSAPSSLAWLVMAFLPLKCVMFIALYQKHCTLGMAGGMV